MLVSGFHYHFLCNGKTGLESYSDLFSLFKEALVEQIHCAFVGSVRLWFTRHRPGPRAFAHWRKTQVKEPTVKPVLNIGLVTKSILFFHKVKDTFFIFTNIFIDLDILSMLSLSRYWFLAGRGQGCC